MGAEAPPEDSRVASPILGVSNDGSPENVTLEKDVTKLRTNSQPAQETHLGGMCQGCPMSPESQPLTIKELDTELNFFWINEEISQ